MPKRWQDDVAFVAWMCSKNYIVTDAKGGTRLKHFFSGDGIILYMHEAWCAGRDANHKRKGATRG